VARDDISPPIRARTALVFVESHFQRYPKRRVAALPADIAMRDDRGKKRRATDIALSHPGAPGTPAGRIGHAVRRQREGSGGVNPGGVPDSGSPAQPPGPPGTYRPQYALGAHDLSPAVLGTIAGEASTRNPAALDAVINNMMNRVGAKGYGPSGNLEEVARSQGVSGRQPQYTGFRTPSAAEAKIISDRIKAIASGGEPDTTHGSMEYRGAGLYQNFKARHPEGVGIGGNWFFPTIKPGPYAASAQPNKMAGALPSRPVTPTPPAKGSQEAWDALRKTLAAGRWGTPEGKRSVDPYQGDPTDPAFDKNK
jgi:hypothetical protein